MKREKIGFLIKFGMIFDSFQIFFTFHLLCLCVVYSIECCVRNIIENYKYREKNG